MGDAAKANGKARPALTVNVASTILRLLLLGCYYIVPSESWSSSSHQYHSCHRAWIGQLKRPSILGQQRYFAVISERSTIVLMQRRRRHDNVQDTRSPTSPPPVKDTTTLSRRSVLLTSITATAAAVTTANIVPAVSHAGELGAQITKAVTTSDLGLSVRRSVVQGAQVMDQIDGQWEKWSDQWKLGSARSQQLGRPAPKIIPAPKPLNTALAEQYLTVCDQTFTSVTQLAPSVLAKQIQKVRATVRPSFQRSGLDLDSSSGKDDAIVLTTGPQFNFESYVHFKAYSDLIIERNIDFRKFKPKFEQQVGQKLAGLFSSTSSTSIKADVVDTTSLISTASKSATAQAKRAALGMAISRIDQYCAHLVQQGFVARIDLAPLDPTDVEDWAVGDLTDLTWSIALDGDVTLQSQMLLQEQGFRLYPNYARYAVESILTQLLPTTQDVTTMDYYLDTDYNSDPEKFEVKEVLVNINIESR